MGTICIKPNPKTTANDLRELEKATEKITAAPAAPSQCLLWNSQMLLLWRNLQQHKNDNNAHPSIWIIGYWGISQSPVWVCLVPPQNADGSSPEPLTSGRTRKSRSREQPSSKWINHSKNAQLFPGVYQKIAEQNKTKSPNKTKPNQNIPLAAKSCHSFQGIKQSSTCRDFPEGPVPEFSS